jgi:hypothetical protein
MEGIMEKKTIEIRKPARYRARYLQSGDEVVLVNPLPFDPDYWNDISSSARLESLIPLKFEVKIDNPIEMSDYTRELWDKRLRDSLDFMAEVNLDFATKERYWYELGRI